MLPEEIQHGQRRSVELTEVLRPLALWSLGLLPHHAENQAGPALVQVETLPVVLAHALRQFACSGREQQVPRYGEQRFSNLCACGELHTRRRVQGVLGALSARRARARLPRPCMQYRAACTRNEFAYGNTCRPTSGDSSPPWDLNQARKLCMEGTGKDRDAAQAEPPPPTPAMQFEILARCNTTRARVSRMVLARKYFSKLCERRG